MAKYKTVSTVSDSIKWPGPAWVRNGHDGSVLLSINTVSRNGHRRSQTVSDLGVFFVRDSPERSRRFQAMSYVGYLETFGGKKNIYKTNKLDQASMLRSRYVLTLCYIIVTLCNCLKLLLREVVKFCCYVMLIYSLIIHDACCMLDKK